MLKKYFFLLAIALLSSCNNKQQTAPNTVPPNTTETSEDKEKPIIPTLISKVFIEIDSLSDYVMYPLTWKKNMEQNRKSSWLGSGSKDGSNYHDWNILFYNTKTNKSHLLHQQTNLFITDIIIKDVKKEEYDNSYGRYENKTIYDTQKLNISKPDYIFYLVLSEDYNKNGLLETNIDPSYLYISDRDGKNFRQLSPKNIHVQDWKFISQNEILLHGIQDTNQDKTFDDDFDRNLPFHITILPNEIKTDMIITDSLQQILQKQFSEFYSKNLIIKE